MSRHWSCSRFADLVRGTDKLRAGTMEQWGEWHRAAAATHAFRYWLSEVALRRAQDFFTYPLRTYYSIRHYVNNRWVTKAHALTAAPIDIRPGNWCDVGDRFLPCLFNSLVDFVEVEKASLNGSEGRDRANGLAHLDWEISLVVDHDPNHKQYGKPTLQAIAAKEIKHLYLWWTETYRNRVDIMESSGWSAHCAAMRVEPGCVFSGRDMTPADKERGSAAHKLLQKLEAANEKEEMLMMVRLIRVRSALWT